MATTSRSSKCRCCPYGFHIDLDFVTYAEDANKGQQLKRTPIIGKKYIGERALISPLDSIFSDSLENILSDFDEALAERPSQLDLTTKRLNPEYSRQRLQNGYLSDYTGYNSNTGSEARNVNVNGRSRPFALDFNAPPKPPHRSMASDRATLHKSSPSAYTALGRTITEIKARNTESPFPDREFGSRVGSRVGTPIDLGLTTVNGTVTAGNGGTSIGNGYATPIRYPIRNELDFGKDAKFYVEQSVPERPSHLPPPLNGPPWRRVTTEVTPVDMNSSYTETRQNGYANDFASLRRGREYAMSDTEAINRVRYYSASPKLPRRLQTTPLTSPSHFTYTQQNGHTILAKTQGTSMSPNNEITSGCDLISIRSPKESRSVSVSTGPLPPAKPCIECPIIRKELREAISRIPSSRPTMNSIATATDLGYRIPGNMVDIAVGNSVQFLDIGTETEKKMVDRGSDSWSADLADLECQTESLAVMKSLIDVWNATSTEVQTEYAFLTEQEQSLTHPVLEDKSTLTEMEILKEQSKDNETMTNRTYYRNILCQTEPENEEKINILDSVAIGCQTEFDEEVKPRVLEESEIADSLWLIPAKTKAEVAITADNSLTYMDTTPQCVQCLRKEQIFTRNVGVGACSVEDKVCIGCDNTNSDEVDENEAPGFKVEENNAKVKRFELARAAAVKKLLTSEQKQNFVRGTVASRSARMERKKGDDLEYIEQKNKAPSTFSVAPATTPAGETSDALRSKVVLKKEIPVPPSKVPHPVPAHIPRPKISKYALPAENAETPDEEDEASDRLTPLRSELRSLGRWQRASPHISYSPYKNESESDDESDDSEGSYETNEEGNSQGTPFEISVPLREALESLNSHLLQPGTITADTTDWALKYVQHEWLKSSARKNSRPEVVEMLVEQLKELSPSILKTVVNITDQNGNTALHYAVSHANFLVVSALLDSAECQLNLANKAGYTAVMLAALSSLENDIEKAVVQRLFEMGDVNARAAQHGQTALMLSVSHGKRQTTELLLQCGAKVNLQDEEGSTALMCAAEHGHKDLVKLLLAQAGIDAALTDCDSSTALSIAVENGHRDIGVLIYAHLNYNRAESLEDA